MIALLAVAVSWLPCASCRADTISAVGGLMFGRDSGFNDIKTPTPLLGVEYTFDLGSRLQGGGFYDHNLLAYTGGTGGALRYVGAVLRASLRETTKSGPFIYAKAGLAQRTQEESSSNQKLSFGGGAGYRFVLSPVVSVNPRLAVRSLPDAPYGDAGNHPLYDASLMFSFTF